MRLVMRFLLDANLPRPAAAKIKQLGHEHWQNASATHPWPCARRGPL
jgi:hypothetical protein